MVHSSCCFQEFEHDFALMFLLDYSIRGSLTSFISTEFYASTGREGPLAWHQSRALEFNSLCPHNFLLRVFHLHYYPLGS
jgi:hypothetical protein